MNFVHCMCCGFWPTGQPEVKIKILLSECGRLVCEACLVAQNHKCSCQQSDRCKLAEMNQIGKEVKEFFSNPTTLLQNALSKPMQVFRFQAAVQKSFTRKVSKMNEVTKSVEAENMVLKMKNHVLTAKLRKLQKEMEILKAEKKRLVKTTIPVKWAGPQFNKVRFPPPPPPPPKTSQTIPGVGESSSSPIAEPSSTNEDFHTPDIIKLLRALKCDNS